MDKFDRESICQASEVVSIRELAYEIWDKKLFIILLVAMFELVGALYLYFQPKMYRAETLLAPSDEAAGGGLSAMSGSLGGLASLAGINLGAQSDSVGVAIETMKSRKFINQFVDKYQINIDLMAVNGWDRKTDKLLYSSRTYDVSKEEWGRQLDYQEPTQWAVYETFLDALTVTRDQGSGLVTVSLTYYSPYVASEWLQRFVEQLNQYIRARDIQELKKSIHYLQLQLDQTSLSYMKTVFSQLIEEQTKQMMLAEVRDEYVFSMVDPPLAPEKHAFPKAPLVLALSFVVSLIFGMFFVIFHYIFKRS